jgi:hypothetical protein
MKHKSSRDLYTYWDAQRGKRLAPERAEIEPSHIRHLLGDSFILTVDASGGHPFRLAGTRVCALFDRELKDEPFTPLWSALNRPDVDGILEILAEESVGVVAGVSAENSDNAPIELELLLLPLGARRPGQTRAIGVLAPLQIPDWLGMRPLTGLVLGSRRHVGPAVETQGPRFMAAAGRNRRGFVVYDGGRTQPKPKSIVPNTY